ncbi:TetR/AcrR family transcriptional regulator [Ramlibacter henchirensis]|uniref:TetR/AcrR family transcriptional regulator n=1 Tax=Ramlibacter henchirensis TaxID=204072 RepID=A0A4Z0BX04_9BURK|nr:TetR/AcrR family transcriptional regulator [Ramlibacter henchirensis]TFZ02788.1 TetR/AcrR family transcriptional regulator [Ramlibacter henchirensis]
MGSPKQPSENPLPTKKNPSQQAPAKAGGRSPARSASTSTAAAAGAAALRPRSPGRVRSDASRVAILAATLKLLESTPLQQISIESIAREAGVGKATIYRWWNSKAAVVIEAFLHTHVSHTPMPKGGSPRDALTRHIHLLVEEYSGWSGRIVAQIMAEGQGDPDVLREFRERFWYGRRAVVREVVEDARRRGEFRTDMDTELQMDILYAPIYFRLFMRHLPLDRKFADAHCEAMMQVLAPIDEGVAAPSKRRKTA